MLTAQKSFVITSSGFFAKIALNAIRLVLGDGCQPSAANSVRRQNNYEALRTTIALEPSLVSWMLTRRLLESRVNRDCSKSLVEYVWKSNRGQFSRRR